MSYTRAFPKDLRELLMPYKGQWVVLSKNEDLVLGNGIDMGQALEMAKENFPNEKRVLLKVPDDGHGFVVI